MGAGQKQARNFFNVANGKFVRSFKVPVEGSDEEEVKKEYYDTYVGKIVAIHKLVDTFEGKSIDKYELRMLDTDAEEEKVDTIKFTAGTWFSKTFFERVTNIDIETPFTIGVYKSEKVDKVSFCYMYQGGNKIEKDEEFAKVKKVKINGKEQNDFGDVIAMESSICESLNDTLSKIYEGKYQFPEKD
jgi:hypothetical protein